MHRAPRARFEPRLANRRRTPRRTSLGVAKARTIYDPFGDPQETQAWLQDVGGLQREVAESLPDDQHPADFAAWVTTGKTQYDGFGNVVFRRGPNHRCASVRYDNAYHQLAEGETVFAGTAGPNEADCGATDLAASATYDRGLQVPLTVTDVTGATTTAEYDSLGRIYQIFAPRPDRDNVELPPATTAVQYILPDDDGSPPYSRLVTKSQDGLDEGAGDYHVAHAFIDGLGRTIAALAEADPEVDGYQWIVGGLTDYDKKGAERRKYLPWSWDGADPSLYPLSVAPTTPYGQQRYDGFGRAIQTIGLDGTITLETHYHALSAGALDAEDLGPGEHQGTYASEEKDGHGRVTQTTERVRVNGKLEARFVRPAYLPSGEVTSITRSTPGATSVTRTMQYDSIGRMTVNDDPNTSRTVDTVRKTWRYAYNDAGDLIGTSDARGCGVNFAYDAAGRLVTEDYAPCEAHHAAYTKYVPEVGYWYDADDLEDAGEFKNPDCHSGGKNSVQGRLVSVTDRSGKSMTCYDQRGRTVEVARQLVDPFGNRGGRWYNRQAQYDAADRAVMETTGASVPPGVTSYVATSYTQRGTVRTVTSPYGTLVEGIKREPDGMVTEIKYGDGAHTTTPLIYDDLRRLHYQTTYRASFGPSGTLTTQMLLQDEEFVYDRVGNPVEIRDWRIADEWPTGAKPVTRKMRYDDLYRLVRMGYEFEEGSDTWTDPYAAEQEAASLPDNTRDRPMPRADFGAGHRVLEQSWQYDWLGNTVATGDDQHAFWDRSLGTVGNGTPDEGAYKLKSANNTAAQGDHTGSLTTDYDEAGDLINLTVDRAGTCVGGNPCGVMHFAYDWDEIGRLVRARRWDAPNLQSIPPPESVAQATLEYVYDSSDQRTRKTAIDGAGHQLHSLYLSGSLELRHAAFDGTDYELTASTETPYLQAHGVRLARVVHQTPPDEYSTESSTRVFLELGDQLGSTSVVLDLASGELVERSTAYAYGAAESDYRPDRWGKFREDYRFTGKEEDIEVGLQYFGKRFYAPLLQRWVSPDPLAVHAPGQADLNVYAYVHGRVLVAVDPVGLEDTGTQSVQRSSGADRLLGGGGTQLKSEAPKPAPQATASACGPARAHEMPAPGSERSRQDPFGLSPEAPSQIQDAPVTPLDQFVAGDPSGGRSHFHIEQKPDVTGVGQIIRDADVAITGTNRWGKPVSDDARTDAIIRTSVNLAMLLIPLEGRAAGASEGGLVRLGRRGRVEFRGTEVRGVRDLSHVDESTLRAMTEKGFAAKDANGNALILHHHKQNPAGFLVEMPAKNHSIGNSAQHPFGNAPGKGLTPRQRSEFNMWRQDYWKARAQEELGRRGAL